jgi:hypothetical protein
MSKKQQGWKRGEGPYSDSSQVKLNRLPADESITSGNFPGTDISRKVESNASVNGGKAGGLKSGRG